MTSLAAIASPERRIFARTLEAALATGIGVGVAIVGVAIGSAAVIRAGGVLFVVMGPIVGIANAFLLCVHGQTLGKRWLGMRVVRPDGSHPGAIRAFVVRELVVGAIGLVPVLGLLFAVVDGAMMLFSARRRALHDEMADTLVIDVQ